MSLYIASLSSGSNGNCYYIGNGHEAVLIDAGIRCREVERRMANLGLDIRSIKAVFISHEHTDHINGLPVLANKYDFPVYITPPTLQSSRMHLAPELVRSIPFNEVIETGALNVTAFAKEHDAANPCSFIIHGNGVIIGVFTDIGIVCPQLKSYFSQCHAAFLESNYDRQMLEEGNYPLYLKKRIRGGKGHLSNTESLELFTVHRNPGMSHLILAHLSKNNNDPLLVEKLFSREANGVHICVAPRYHETPLFHIQAADTIQSPKKPATVIPMQLELFGASI